MNRIDRLFKEHKPVLSVYFTAGFPELDSTLSIIQALTKHGADMIEIGIPFSDPVADGPVIQYSNERALKNGMTLSLLFEQLHEVRKTTSVPLVMMGYLNPVLQMGMAVFLEKAKQAGIDGIILPDLPPEEYEIHYKAFFEEAGMKVIFLVTPQTSTERTMKIDALTTGFIYLVTTSATTGENKKFDDRQLHYFNSVKSLSLRNPVIAGFGIHDKEGFDSVCQSLDGGIIGSSFIKAIDQKEILLDKAIQQFIQNIRS